MAKKRKMTALQRRYFAKRKKVRPMAKRRYARRAYTRYRRSSYARKGGIGAKQIIDGTLAGVGGAIASKYIGGWGQPIATVGIGMFRHNNTLQTIGGMQLGSMIAKMIPFIGNGGSSGGGVY